MNYSDLAEAFEALNAYEKGLFIDARLAWATGGGLCGEVRLRICSSAFSDDTDDEQTITPLTH